MQHGPTEIASSVELMGMTFEVVCDAALRSRFHDVQRATAFLVSEWVPQTLSGCR